MQVEVKIRQYAADLERSNRDLQHFAYVASHDLQEPLRMIRGFLELLSRRYKGKLDDTADEYIGFAVDGAARMQNLIRGLLAYSRVGTHGKSIAPINAENALNQALLNLQAAVEESGTAITHDELPEVPADGTQLALLFQNLIMNAVKFRSENSPQIHVSVADKKDVWEFAVSDNGIGFDPQHANRIFQMFQRLHGPTKYPGTGIGLALCKRIVERHGGRIWVDTAPKEGLHFPFHASQGGRPQFMSGMAEARPFVILLVEDNPGDVRLAREALQEGKISKRIHVAGDGIEALAFLRNCRSGGCEHGPDLVLLDLNLPGKNGHEVLATIRADEQLRQIPVIVFTSSSAEPDINQAYELHANCYVTKPAGFAELIDTIKRIESFWLATATLPTRPGIHA